MLFKCYCRIYQAAFRIAVKFLRWRKPVLIEGENCYKQLADILKQKNWSPVMLVTDKNLYGMGMCAGLEEQLSAAGIPYCIYKEVQPNPTIDNVEAALAVYTDNKCKAIIALGGGSPMDCAKGAAARAARPKKSIKQMAGVLKVRKTLPPLFAVPTTAGSGSETTLAAVITDSATHRKFAINDVKLIPRYAVLEPALTVNLPVHITSTTGVDALTHAIEAYIGGSNTRETKHNAERAFKLIKENLFAAYTNGKDLTARRNMLLASHYAGLAFRRAYVGNVHAMAHTLGGLYGVPHGLANAVLLPWVLEYYGKAVYKKLAQIADIMEVGGGRTAQEKAQALIAYIRDLNAKMKIPAKIEGIKDEDIPKMIGFALAEANPLYPVPVIFTRDDFKNVFQMIKA
ncbi:MAG: iron-containing alcohol dehydrogenase [Spirochaetota bacterium]|jgi:alcohol dehydrogenase class IV|nr:iron-containing alcohol dehydrogenase [Spirochaetota bacterium]